MKYVSKNKRMAIALGWLTGELSLSDAARMFGIKKNPENVLRRIPAALREAHRADIIRIHSNL